MDILKKHYEKLILLLLLLIFIGLMFHVLSIVQQTGEIQDHHLQIPTREPDYKTQDPNDVSFDVLKIFKDTSLSWVNPGPRTKSDSGVYTDLAYVFKIVKCPFCGKLIPRQYMDDMLVCPFCKNQARNGENFVKPPADIVIPDIPTEIREQYRLSANDPSSDFYDLDGDGFSNIYEYMMETDMGDTRIHPPLWHRLRVIEVGRITLPVTLTSVDMMDSDDPKYWDLKIDSNGMEISYSIGTEFEIDGHYFTIEDIKRQAGAGPDKEDVFTVDLKESTGDMKLQLTTGGVIRSFSDKAVLQDVSNKRQYTVDVGDLVSIGDRRTGTESYRVKNFDVKEGTVLLEIPSKMEDSTLDETGTEMLITGSGRIPPALMVRIPKEPENMPGGYPGYGNPGYGNPGYGNPAYGNPPRVPQMQQRGRTR